MYVTYSTVLRTGTYVQRACRKNAIRSLYPLRLGRWRWSFGDVTCLQGGGAESAGIVLSCGPSAQVLRKTLRLTCEYTLSAKLWDHYLTTTRHLEALRLHASLPKAHTSILTQIGTGKIGSGSLPAQVPGTRLLLTGLPLWVASGRQPNM